LNVAIFVLMLTVASSSSFTNRNKLRLVKSGNEYFELLEQLIREARHYIHLQTYIFAEDETGKRIVKVLIEAAQRNVLIYLVIDSYASQDLSSEFIKNLKEAGIHFRWFDALLKSKYFYLGRRLHHKVLVVDGEHGLVGGINISDHYNDTTQATAWLDYAIYFQGEAVQELQMVCERRTVFGKSFFKRKNQSAPIVETNWSSLPINLVGVRVNDWVRRKREITNSYLDMLRKAESHVIIMSPYFIPGRVLMRALVVAAKRGVKIQLILPGVSDVLVAKYAERYIYSRLFRSNIEIYEYQKKVLHGKISTSDGKWITVGSYNINNISTYASIELNLEIMDSRFVSEVSKELTSVIEQDCKLITESDYRSSRNLITKFLQRGAYDFYRFLFFLFTFYFKQHRE
jgi:cardiolipin synthase